MNMKSKISRSISLYLIMILTGLFFQLKIAAQTGSEQQANSDPDSLGNMKVILRKLDALTDIYGSLRFKAGILYNGESGVQDNASRMGVKGVVPVTKGIDAIMQFEVGVSLVGNKTKIRFGGDPGGAVGEVDNVFTSRLGYAGIKTRYGQFTWGKQWSVYSDVGGWTDSYNGFGAEASGTYSARTDGSISGSGRASNCFQYRLNLKFLEVGLQAQNRSISDSNKTFSDTYGASLIIKPIAGLKIGAAYNKVRDGVPDPEAGKPKIGDEAFVAGFYYYLENFTATFTAAKFKNHEIDDLGNYFSGYGLELYTEYRFKKRWNVYGGFNYLKPEPDGPAGLYRISYIDLGSAYKFGRSSRVFLEIRLDNGKNHDGTLADTGAIGFGMFYEFGY